MCSRGSPSHLGQVSIHAAIRQTVPRLPAAVFVTCCAVPCRAIEAVGLASKGCGGQYVQQMYNQLVAPLAQQQPASGSNGSSNGHPSPLGESSATSHPSHHTNWPVNTHGGLLGFGAPWEVPAMISLVEAVTQLRGEAAGRQVPHALRALVYGNGGIFSASAVAILEAAPEKSSSEQSKVQHFGHAAQSRL